MDQVAVLGSSTNKDDDVVFTLGKFLQLVLHVVGSDPPQS